VTDRADIPRLMSALRQSPPARIGAVAVRQVDDFAGGIAALPASDILRYQLDDGSRVIVRPSGTEPKVKVYIDASSVEGTAAHRQAVAQGTVDRLEAAMRQLLAERV
jgi:phosphomannomutase